MPVLLTLSALWGSFENTENISMGSNVVGQAATSFCDLPGPVEICVDATDGLCTETLCVTLRRPGPAIRGRLCKPPRLYRQALVPEVSGAAPAPPTRRLARKAIEALAVASAL